MKALSLVLFALAVSWASPASAATVTVALDARFHDFNEVRYVAAPGEANDLTVAYAADALSVTVTDPGAAITATGSCTSLSTHSAVCKAPNPPFPIAGQFVQSTRAELGDMNDRAITTRPGPNVIGGIDAFGGPGNDVLIGSPTDDRLDGGGGTDTLTGGDGSDVISDGDTTAPDASSSTSPTAGPTARPARTTRSAGSRTRSAARATTGSSATGATTGSTAGRDAIGSPAAAATTSCCTRPGRSLTAARAMTP